MKEGQEEKELVGRSRSVRVKVEEVELGSERATQTNSSPRAVASLLISDHGGIRKLSPHPSIHNNEKTLHHLCMHHIHSTSIIRFTCAPPDAFLGQSRR